MSLDGRLYPLKVQSYAPATKAVEKEAEEEEKEKEKEEETLGGVTGSDCAVSSYGLHSHISRRTVFLIL